MKVATRLPSTSRFILKFVFVQMLIQLPLPVFKTGALNHSATRPRLSMRHRSGQCKLLEEPTTVLWTASLRIAL